MPRAWLHLTGDIGTRPGDALSASRIAAQIAGAERRGCTDLGLIFDSGGGDLEEATRMAALVLQARRRGCTTTAILNRCDSAATIVALACEEVWAAPGGSGVVHNPFGGPADEWLVLHEWGLVLQDIYRTKSGQPVAAIAKLMDAGERLDAPQLLSLKLIDGILPEAS